MKRINEIFYSLQGEGHHMGWPAVFVRFSGCNLKCPFCDTDHMQGQELTDREILEEVNKYPADLVIFTGGEPSLQLDEALVQLMKSAGKYLCIETNGTHALPEGLDWITLSPKAGMAVGGERIVIPKADEIKVVNCGQDLEEYFSMPQRDSDTLMYLQPCYVDDPTERDRLLTDTIEKVKRDPRWKLSPQLHRLLHIP